MSEFNLWIKLVTTQNHGTIAFTAIILMKLGIKKKPNGFLPLDSFIFLDPQATSTVIELVGKNSKQYRIFVNIQTTLLCLASRLFAFTSSQLLVDPGKVTMVIR